MSKTIPLEELMKKRVAVLMGGRSGEREVSLRSGKGVLEALLRKGVNAVGIDAGDDVLDRLRAEKAEAVFIALHGRYGEDGVIQGLLEWVRIPYTGCGVLASAAAMDKNMSKRLFKHHGVPTPPSVEFTSRDDLEATLDEIEKTVGLPAVIKPAREGSSLGVTIAKSRESLEKDVRAVMREYDEGLAEQFVDGVSVTVGVLGPKGQERTVPILELVPKNEFYDYEAKYTAGMTEFYCPARISEETEKECRRVAIAAHVALGCDGLSRVDQIISKKTGECLVLEVNTLPGMTELSDLPAEAKAEGMSYDDLTLEILRSAGLDK